MNLQKNQIALIVIAAAFIVVIGMSCFVRLSPPKEEYSASQFHIDPSIGEFTGNQSSLLKERSLLIKNETLFRESSSSCQLTGPIRTDSLTSSTDSNITASALYTLYKEEFNATYDLTHDYYIVWMNAAGSSLSGNPKDKSRITGLRAGIILQRDTDRITDWSPYTDTSETAGPHEETVRMGRCGILSETYTLQQGRTGVLSLSPGTPGDAADFIIRWKGDLTGTQVVVGGAEIQVPKNAGYNYTVVLGVNGTSGEND
jgi:hypothetical protein